MASPLNGLFTIDGDRYLPSEFSHGPWRPDAQHGGPPAALLAHLCQSHVETDEFLAQLSVELVRPVPLLPLAWSAARERVSGRVSRVSATLECDGETVAQGTALVLRGAELDPPDWSAESAPATGPPPADAAVEAPRWASGDVTTYHRNAVEHRFTEGSFREPGPAVDWVRLRLPLITGEKPTGLERVVAAADFGSGISAVYGSEARFGLINANLIVSLHREPRGEWVSLDARTHVGNNGTGLGVTMLGDSEGPVGVATQSLLGYSIG